MADVPLLAAVLIGRNEGGRLVRALAAVTGQVDRVVYVDSGSTDGSLAAARAVGAEVVELDLSHPFTAARARNAGAKALRESGAYPEFIQFIDGDCELQPGWLAIAQAFLEAHPRAAAACGRLRERHPEVSIWNRLCDREWDTPVGRTKACGGIVLMRAAAFDEAGGFYSALIAGEEPELCVRMRSKGWEIWRLDAEMAWHDAAMTRFSQWWKRTRRGGYAAAEGMAMHGRPPERLGVAQVRRAVAWGFALPLVVLILVLAVSLWALALLLVYPAQVMRLARRYGGGRSGWEQALLLTLGKFAEAVGVAEFWLRRLSRRPAGLIEYK